MSKFGLYSDKAGAAIPFESYLEGLDEETNSTARFKKFCKKSWR
jgi:hypothetical protein